MDEKERKIEQYGDRNLAIIAENGSKVEVNQSLKQTPADLSRPLEIHGSNIGNSHIERKETKELLEWIEKSDESSDSNKRITVLLGAAGSGKSVIMKDVYLALKGDEKYEVVALKSDIIYDDGDSSQKSIEERANLGKSILQYITDSAKQKRTVLLVDQVDALSIVLSSRRKPLAEIMGLVTAASKITNVRIIISCRQYDFFYDLSFAEIKKGSRLVAVERIGEQDVRRVLQENSIVAENISKELMELLGNPLHLSLYCTIKPDAQQQIRTLTDLYDCLWSNVLDSYPGASKEVVDFLWTFTYQLYTRQILSIHPNLLSSDWHHVGQYLLSKNIIVENNRVWQFMHQTLFDYVFARLFFEKHQTLKEIFEEKHQGLFVRNQLKQVLEYQHATDLAGYIANVRTILFEKTEDGFKHRYRFHIRHLVLSMLAGNEQLSKEEILLIKRQIFTNKLYLYHFTNNTISLAGFNVFREWLGKKGGFLGADELSQKYMMTIISKVITIHRNEVLQYIRSLCKDSLSEVYRKQLTNIINGLREVELNDDLKYIVDFLDRDDSNIIFSSLMHDNVDKTEWVSERLKRCVRAIYKQASEEKEIYFYPNVPHEAHLLYDNLRKKYPQIAYDLSFELVRYISEISILDVQDEIKLSKAYWSFNRHDSISHHFHEEMVKDMMEYMEKLASVESEESYIAKLDKLIETDLVIMHVIASAVLTSAIDKYERYAFAYMKNNLTRLYHSSSLSYYHLELFKAWIGVNKSDEALEDLLKVVDTMHPEWEKVSFPHENRTWPLTKEGYTRAQYYKHVPEEQLKQNEERYRYYQECQYRFEKIEDAVEPNKTEWFEGYSSIKPGAMDHMDDEEFLNMMRTHVKDDFYDFKKPTMTGASREMASKVSEDSDRFYAIYMKALSDTSIPLQYIMDGLEALMEAEYNEEKINTLYIKLIEEAKKRGETNKAVTNITLCRDCDFYTKHQKRHVPRGVYDFVKSVALHPSQDIDDMEDIDYNVSINRERGCAIWELMKCMYDEEYVKELFPTLFAIVPEASVTSKVGILFQMAYLLNVNRKQTLELFLEITRDYNHNYFTLPVHDGNPLLYLIRTNFDDLVPYFTAAMQSEKGQDVTANLLFRAWVGGSDAAKQMLYDFADMSPVARVQLVDLIARYCSKNLLDKMYEVLLRYMSYKEEDLGRKYDYTFEKMENWLTFFPVRDYMDRFKKSEVCVYASHFVYKFLKNYTNEDPEYCLQFIAALYVKKAKEYEVEYYELREITEILITAYNNVRTYDAKNKALESAMDMLDELLEKEDVNYYLDKCLYEVTE